MQMYVDGEPLPAYEEELHADFDDLDFPAEED